MMYIVRAGSTIATFVSNVNGRIEYEISTTLEADLEFNRWTYLGNELGWEHKDKVLIDTSAEEQSLRCVIASMKDIEPVGSTH